MDMTLDAAIARHCRRVLTITGSNKKRACRLLGITPWTLNKYLALARPSLADVPDYDDDRETTAQQLLRLQASISSCLLRCAALLGESGNESVKQRRKRRRR